MAYGGCMNRVVLVHGAATTPRIWDDVLARLGDIEVVAPQRPCSGDLELETDWLEEYAPDSIVVGMSGGATLVLELARRRSRAVALIAHEPAAGSLVPELFLPLAAALKDGVESFGRALYGSQWQRDSAVSESGVHTDLAMFRTFEPGPPHPSGPVPTITTGANSPAVRHKTADRLAVLGYKTESVTGCAHLIAKEAPAELVRLIRHVG